MKLKQYIKESSNLTIKTTKVLGHIHDATVNADGDGKTIGEQDHEHIIYQWMVQPAKGHIHNLEE